MTSAACCTGNVHPGDPKGTTGTMHGVSTYISEPPNGAEVKGIVVMIPDAFGWEFVNLRLLADSFAERIGVRCLLPEFMDGNISDLLSSLQILVSSCLISETKTAVEQAKQPTHQAS